ncbi:MAG: CAP domain-containing protein [Leptolyngbya sp. IPPAS B-1204]|uniref:CAP domain-containing protein n=1 Tax=Leptolyngbya sp. NK1-12 TaxID=2547451 RepID=A0AA97AFP7_9CYAN|nr:CAP domain-containing protein [Leptolyngbya sp. NK1-12]MBF2046281.1 CAP domain-containing protein [Elainella sp. C42_A2020_010]RNJ70455.1 MAG: CAP domain-containing protein [Leptolyngbya sp. IPPAS B-1204]WNZ23415.1 CAP domain-containing protein [Leptolyngbya sp. NK1-12]
MRSVTHLRSATTIKPRSGPGNYRGLVGATNPTRYYRLQLNQRSSLNLSLSGLQANADLALVNQRGKVIGRSAGAGQNSETINQTVAPGTYYVRVRRQQGTTRYQLTINVNAAQQAAIASQFSASSGNALVDQVVALVNVQRQQIGLKPLRLNPFLTASAQAHSQDMALNDFFGHQGSNGSTADQRILAAGYNYATLGENIGAGFSTPEGVMRAWMESPPHRGNILHPALEEIGVGFYFLENDPGDANFRYYWTQNFGKPLR